MPLLPTHFSSHVLPCMNLQFYYKGEENTSAGSSFSVKEVKCSVKKVFLEISQNSQEIPVPETPATLLKRRLWHRCFSVNFTKFLRTHFFTEHLWWLRLCILLKYVLSHCWKKVFFWCVIFTSVRQQMLKGMPQLFEGRSPISTVFDIGDNLFLEIKGD